MFNPQALSIGRIIITNKFDKVIFMIDPEDLAVLRDLFQASTAATICASYWLGRVGV